MTATTAPPQIERVVVEGFSGYRLCNGKVSLTVIPELGGKIVELQDLRSGRNWLQRNPHIPLARHAYAASYLRDGDSGGWDECFPTVAECPMPGAPEITVPDHGELWPLSWIEDFVRADPNSAQLGLSSKGQIAAYVFSRAISISADKAAVRFDYEVRSRAASALPFIWSAHPILDLLPGSTIELPPGTEFALHAAFPDLLSGIGKALELPFQNSMSDGRHIVGPLPGPEARQAIKVWTTKLPQGRARLVDPLGANCIEFRFDLAAVPNLGLWFNLGGWAGRPEWQGKCYCVAIEPCIGAQDRLDEAVERHNQYGILEPGAVRQWSVTVDLEPGPWPEKGKS